MKYSYISLPSGGGTRGNNGVSVAGTNMVWGKLD